MKRKIISIVLIVILLQCMVTTVIGASLEDEKDNVQDKINSATNEKNKVTAEKETVINEISELEDSIENYEAQLKELNKKITELEKNITDKTTEISKLEKEYDEKQDLLTQKLVAIYEEGQPTMLDVFLSSNSLSDYLSGSVLIQQLTEADNKIMDELETQRKGVEKAKKELETQKQELDNSKKSAQAKAQQLKVAKSAKETKVANLSAEQKELQTEIEKYKKEVARLEEEIRKAAEAAEGEYEGNFKGTLSWPLSSSSSGYNSITSYFGNRESPVPGASTNHRGIDIGVRVGTPVYSAADGYVVTKGSSSLRGIYVMVKHADNLYTFYQHLNAVHVSQGQNVKRGQKIASSGNTGIGSGPHLHFEVRTGPNYGDEVNPLNYAHW